MAARVSRLPLVSGVLVAVMVAIASAITLSGQSRPPTEPDVLIGTWQLNLAKSRYTPGPPPKNEVRIYAPAPEGVKGVIERTHANGRVERIEYVANYDRVYPVTGAVEYDAIQLKRVDSHTSESVLSHAGRVFGYARRTISIDGRQMIITFRRESEDGLGLVNYTAVYDKIDR